MRVIGGEFGGRKIPSPKSDTIRPTSDFVRESIFNTISNLIDIEGAVICDFFAGTGALGLEALSRGADFVFFVEKNRANAKNISDLMKDFDIDKNHYSVICNEVKKALNCAGNFPKKIDLIFADPPYAIKAINETFELSIRNLELSDNAIFILEFGQNESLLIPDGWRAVSKKKYGETKVEILMKDI